MLDWTSQLAGGAIAVLTGAVLIIMQRWASGRGTIHFYAGQCRWGSYDMPFDIWVEFAL